MKVGLIREGKIPLDKRVALTPAQCKEAIQQFPDLEIVVERSPFRCYKDAEYTALGIEVVEDVANADVLLGIKEVPVTELIPQKTYFFFSHTTKKQAYNRNLLLELLNKKIRMVDYEMLLDEKEARLIAFGRYAGLVGAYNALLAYGKRYNTFTLKPAHRCFDLQEMNQEIKKIRLPNLKIVLTGGGRVTRGAMETLNEAQVKAVSNADFLAHSFNQAVYTQLDPKAYNRRKDGKPYDQNSFYTKPQDYESTFLPYAETADLLITGAYWNPQAPGLFSKADAKSADFKIKIIADIACDIEGAVPITKRASTIDEPLYDYNPKTEQTELPLSSEKNITLMAVDNLPNELPRDASKSFGKQFIKKILPKLLSEDKDNTIAQATLTANGKLEPAYEYLQNFVDGKEE